MTAADACLLSFDCYLREQDWCQLRASDVADTRRNKGGADGDMALLLGVQSRGERVKTGMHQGCVLDYPGVRAMLRKRLRGSQPDDKVFPLTQARYRDIFYKASTHLDVLQLVGRPHNVRHTGPSYDKSIAYRNLDSIQKRGRWLAAASVSRYSKVHEYTRAVAATPSTHLQRGAPLLRALGQRKSTEV